MIVELIKEVNKRLNQYFNDVPIISQDIDKNEVFPCFKVNVINPNLKRITPTILEYNYDIVINYYPKIEVDKRIKLLTVLEMLNQIFAFEIDGWFINSKELINDEDFITCIVSYTSTRIFNEDYGLSSGLTEDIDLIEIREYENIENIEYKEEN